MFHGLMDLSKVGLAQTQLDHEPKEPWLVYIFLKLCF
jgi:hypothetical protein